MIQRKLDGLREPPDRFAVIVVTDSCYLDCHTWVDGLAVFRRAA